jgi:KAP family P-loop domain
VLYFYFDYTEQTVQTPSNILSTLLHQLLSHLSALPDAASLLLERIQQSRPLPNWKQMINIFITIANSQDKVFLVLDALDECDPNKNREKVLDFLDYIFDQSSIRALITSRPYPSDIKSAFAALPEVVIEASEADIRTFLIQKIASSKCAWIKKNVYNKLRIRIINTLVAKSHGMYVSSNFVLISVSI